MVKGGDKHVKKASSAIVTSPKPRQAWKTRAYLVPTGSRRGVQWKASALRGLTPLMGGASVGKPVTVVVPALYSILPAETVAMGWLNEIDALGTIHHRITHAARITGWDVFTFHTQHNLDPYFNTTIA